MSKNKLIVIISAIFLIILGAVLGILSVNPARLKANAVINPEMIEVKTEAAGILKDIYVKPQQPVEKGQLIAEIEVSKAMNKPVQKPDVSAAKAKLNKAEEKYKNSALMYKDGVITQEDYDKSLENLTSAQNAYKNAVDKANAITEEQNKLKNAVDIKKVYAPRDGVVNANYVNKGQETNSENPILLLALKTPKVTAFVDEKTAAELTRGNEVEIIIKNKSLKGVIEVVSDKPSVVAGYKEPVYTVYIGFKDNVDAYGFKASQPAAVRFK